MSEFPYKPPIDDVKPESIPIQEENKSLENPIEAVKPIETKKPIEVIKPIEIVKKTGQNGKWKIEEATDEHFKLLYLISKYSSPSNKTHIDEIWMKELPLRVFAFEAICEQIFEDYDYAPMSTEIPGGRRFLNISQEMEDDIADLREMGVLHCLKLSTVTYMLINAYMVTFEGLKMLKNIPPKFKKEIDSQILCLKCKQLLETKINPNSKENDDVIYIYCKNEACEHYKFSGITEIEDVSYKTTPYIPNIKNYHLLKFNEKRGDKNDR